MKQALAVGSNAVVNSFNEWDPLEEVIVGILDGEAIMPWDVEFAAILPDEVYESAKPYHTQMGGKAFKASQLGPAQKELDAFVHVLESEGVTVRRPDPIDHAQSFKTPDFESVSGHGQYNPRDVITVIGNEIIESSMGWRTRFFEYRAYRRLVKEYFKQGAKWTAAPKAQMSQELFRQNHKRDPVEWEWVTTEFEPVFDAADIIRCGKDLFFQRSHASNEFAIEWLQRHLGDTYRVHHVEFDDYRAHHIDATFFPLAPGKVLVNPDRPLKTQPVLDLFKKAGWDLLMMPRTTYPRNLPSFRSFEWLIMNVLNLDEQRVIVEKEEEPFIRALKDWGFKPIPVAYRNCYKHGGSFHCSTVDIRRRGGLQSYF